MLVKSLNTALFFCCVSSAAACGGATSSTEDTNEASSELSTRTEHYVKVRPDTQTCGRTTCGGYLVADVNGHGTDTHVARIDFSATGLDAANIERATTSAVTDVVLRGKFGAFDWSSWSRPFLVDAAYLATPDVTAGAGAPSSAFYGAAERTPKIFCIVAPCNNERASKLNAKEAPVEITTIDLSRPYPDAAVASKLVERVTSGTAIVSATVREGQLFPGGYEQVLDAGRVFLQLPDAPTMP